MSERRIAVAIEISDDLFADAVGLSRNSRAKSSPSSWRDWHRADVRFTSPAPES